MRVRVFMGCVSAALVASALGVQACSTDDDAAPDGPDASEGGTREGGAVLDVSAPEPLCDPKADLLAKVKDASIGDGASTTGICLGCARAHCEDAIRDCTRDCACQRIVGNAIECYLTTQQIGCAAELANILVTPATRKYALEVLGCAQTECPAECAVDGGTVPDSSADASPE